MPPALESHAGGYMLLGFGWTVERTELLKTRWAEGASCGTIARELGGITRNSVVGKVHRLGLSGHVRDKPATAPKPRKPRKPYLAQAPIPKGKVIGRIARGGTSPREIIVYEAESEPEIVECIIPLGQRCTLLQLNDSKCRWPIGDVGSESFFFCGGGPVEGLPYCSAHSRCAFQPASGRRRDARWAGGQMRSI